jgi:hypothetical protein
VNFYYICYKFSSFYFLVSFESILFFRVLGSFEDMEEFFVDFFGRKNQGYSFELAVVAGVTSREIGESCWCGYHRMGVLTSTEWAGDYLHNIINDML